jgi:hypothetical protein
LRYYFEKTYGISNIRESFFEFKKEFENFVSVLNFSDEKNSSENNTRKGRITSKSTPASPVSSNSSEFCVVSSESYPHPASYSSPSTPISPFFIQSVHHTPKHTSPPCISFPSSPQLYSTPSVQKNGMSDSLPSESVSSCDNSNVQPFPPSSSLVSYYSCSSPSESSIPNDSSNVNIRTISSFSSTSSLILTPSLEYESSCCDDSSSHSLTNSPSRESISSLISFTPHLSFPSPLPKEDVLLPHKYDNFTPDFPKVINSRKSSFCNCCGTLLHTGFCICDEFVSLLLTAKERENNSNLSNLFLNDEKPTNKNLNSSMKPLFLNSSIQPSLDFSSPLFFPENSFAFSLCSNNIDHNSKSSENKFFSISTPPVSYLTSSHNDFPIDSFLHPSFLIRPVESPSHEIVVSFLSTLNNYIDSLFTSIPEMESKKSQSYSNTNSDDNNDKSFLCSTLDSKNCKSVFIGTARIPVIKINYIPYSTFGKENNTYAFSNLTGNSHKYYYSKIHNLNLNPVEADVSFGSVSGIINTDYIRCLLVVYYKARPLILVIKAYLYFLKMSEPYHGGLGLIFVY